MGTEISDLAGSFLTAMRGAGRSERTQELRLKHIRFYSDWLIQNGRAATMEELTRENIQLWCGDLSDRLEAVTVAGYFAGIRRFCNWLVEEGELERSPMAGLPLPQSTAKPVPVLSDEELALLLKACAGRSFKCRRDEAFIRFLLDCGVRVSEACKLTRSDLNIRDEAAMVRGKGDKLRAVYFGAKTAVALDRYMRERAKHRFASYETVWLTQRGALSGDGARDLLRNRALQAGLDGRMHPHRFRHTFAHDFLLAGGQERDLKRLAGWTSDVMLERYGQSAADVRARQASKRLRRGDRV